ncbi:glutamate--tRNA ligase [Candidatus Jorgensenbacteria bacterium GWA1_54_12]|uniref:Glutamate--tRNA ligase n=1 Tax=Candidatus Jorgensenbacteria bacterium GWA1_54_12 TaxID=1798468 RepID=A0A1F6BL39_9BACT|nr:MAG: glutamate--tRNA ligase [Candidatus Jorgensenbacteria bacterium GWA1_54_12]
MDSAPKTPVRTRFAPSPTGPFSVGNARTALFAWLYARRNGGTFLLRIEDTDMERSKPEYEEQIRDSLAWLGLNWDETPLRQSERRAVYEKYIKKLLEEKKAYFCFCSEEELEADRTAQLSQGLAPKYGGRCRSLTDEESARRAALEPHVIRFRMPQGSISFTDLIRGEVTFEADIIGDFIIAKDERTPLYNFAVVIDDEESAVTHVVRGEDHLSNTPRQIALQKALGFGTPVYAHLPLLLDAERQKLSKRRAQTSLLAYRHEGYLADAMFNFLLLLGWHPEGDEIVGRDEALKRFDLSRVQKAGAVWSDEKLSWMNAHYIRAMETSALLTELASFVPKAWQEKKELLAKAVGIEKERMKTLADFASRAGFFFELPDYPPDMLFWDEKPDESKENIRALHAALEETLTFTPEFLTATLEARAKETGKGAAYWPFRVALSGEQSSPGGIEIALALGREETLRRLEIAIEKVEA